VRKEVFGIEGVPPEDGYYSVTDGWTLTLLSKKQEQVPDFATLMAKRMGLKSGKEFVQGFKRYFEIAVQRDDAAKISGGKKRRGNGSTQKKGKARRVSKKPSASAASAADETDTADEDADAADGAGDEDTADADAAADQDKEEGDEGDKEDGDEDLDEEEEEEEEEEATPVTPAQKPVLRRRR